MTAASTSNNSNNLTLSTQTIDVVEKAITNVSDTVTKTIKDKVDEIPKLLDVKQQIKNRETRERDLLKAQGSMERLIVRELAAIKHPDIEDRNQLHTSKFDRENLTISDFNLASKNVMERLAENLAKRGTGSADTSNLPKEQKLASREDLYRKLANLQRKGVLAQGKVDKEIDAMHNWNQGGVMQLFNPFKYRDMFNALISENNDNFISNLARKYLTNGQTSEQRINQKYLKKIDTESANALSDAIKSNMLDAQRDGADKKKEEEQQKKRQQSYEDDSQQPTTTKQSSDDTKSFIDQTTKFLTSKDEFNLEDNVEQSRDNQRSLTSTEKLVANTQTIVDILSSVYQAKRNQLSVENNPTSEGGSSGGMLALLAGGATMVIAKAMEGQLGPLLSTIGEIGGALVGAYGVWKIVSPILKTVLQAKMIKGAVEKGAGTALTVPLLTSINETTQAILARMGGLDIDLPGKQGEGRKTPKPRRPRTPRTKQPTPRKLPSSQTTNTGVNKAPAQQTGKAISIEAQTSKPTPQTTSNGVNKPSNVKPASVDGKTPALKNIPPVKGNMLGTLARGAGKVARGAGPLSAVIAVGSAGIDIKAYKNELDQKVKSGEITQQQADQALKDYGAETGMTAGGSAVGALIGGAIGSILGPAGTIVGTTIGAELGSTGMEKLLQTDFGKAIKGGVVKGIDALTSEKNLPANQLQPDSDNGDDAALIEHFVQQAKKNQSGNRIAANAMQENNSSNNVAVADNSSRVVNNVSNQTINQSMHPTDSYSYLRTQLSNDYLAMSGY